MVLHAPLTITEQHHHDQFDLFPDFGRQVPFGTGTSIFYNYLKYHIASENERFVREDGVVCRCGEVYRTMVDKATGNVLSRELLRRNHARVLYDPAGPVKKEGSFHEEPSFWQFLELFALAAWRLSRSTIYLLRWHGPIRPPLDDLTEFQA